MSIVPKVPLKCPENNGIIIKRMYKRCAMYEMRQQKIKEMKEKKWFYYALLAIAIFLFSQGSSMIKTNLQYVLPLIIISFILHIRSVASLTERAFKKKPSIISSIAMIVVLSATSVICFFNPLKLSYIILLDFAAVAVYVITEAIFHKFKTGE